jgi:hypothetical protein
LHAYTALRLLYFYDEYKKIPKNSFFYILYADFIESTLAYNDDRVLLIVEEFAG